MKEIVGGTFDKKTNLVIGKQFLDELIGSIKKYNPVDKKIDYDFGDK